MPWIDRPSDPLMRPGISPLAKTIQALTPYILGKQSTVGRPIVTGAKRVDATTWATGGKTLLIALNLNNASVQAQVQIDHTHGKASIIFENGAQLVQGGDQAITIRFQPLSSIAMTL